MFIGRFIISFLAIHVRVPYKFLLVLHVLLHLCFVGSMDLRFFM